MSTDRPLRIATLSVHACPLAPLGSWETGGMNVYIREVSRHLSDLGVEVYVFTRQQGEHCEGAGAGRYLRCMSMHTHASSSDRFLRAKSE